MIKKLFSKYYEIISYLFFGGLTTLVNILVFYLFSFVFNYAISNVIAWIVSVIFAFVVNKLFVFKSLGKDKVRKEIISFFSFRILSLGIDMLFMYLLISVLFVNDLISKILVNIIVVIINYVFSKLFIFKKVS